jgi:carotenoid cleavage dioxygenase-like enzyme
MAHFPQTPAFTGFNTPSRIEADIVDLAHEGTIPRELNGAFFRVQPDPQFPPRLGDDISFNGDGMITRSFASAGRVPTNGAWRRPRATHCSVPIATRSRTMKPSRVGSGAPPIPTPSFTAASSMR